MSRAKDRASHQVLTPPHPVLHIAAPAAVGGLERVVQGLASGQRARGWDVHVAAIVDRPDHPFLAPLRDADVPTHVLRIDGSGGFLKERRFIGRLLGETKPRVVHTHGYRPDLLDAPVARRRGIATVTTEHGSSKMGGKAALYEWVQARMRKRFDAVVAVSSPIAARLEAEERVSPDRIHLIPNAWAGGVSFLSRSAARRQLDLDPDELAVGWVGRMIVAKGPDLMARALPHMGPRGSVVFVGDGPLGDQVEQSLEQLGVRDRARLIGHVDHAAPLFRAFDLLVLSSRTEGTPIVLLEAMAAGIPIVATAVGGVTDMISQAEAFLVDSTSPDAIGRTVREALKDPEERTARAARAAHRLETELNADVWLDRHRDAYEAAMQQAAASP